ncbi:ATP-binding protein [Halomicrobium sp. LC1Hm]|uniref:ATP-binding protein n=1 Tax=Halomicrobium sp. LC1Hm TaxID=2610902 RepID=UPI001298363F|nr:ATP-binding protein [Halomicrobium sp. LC1Hm]QGA83596.1 ATPase of the AAA+ class, CDC48 family [Halomicrobium sp. LC1Hm]
MSGQTGERGVTIPDHIEIDQPLLDGRSVAAGFRSNDQTWCDGHDQLQGLLRVLYPAYRVEYTYAVEGRFPWSSPDHEREHALLDGLWEDNDAGLAMHRHAATETTTIDPRARYGDASVPTVALGFHGDEARAASVLPTQLEHERERIDRQIERWHEQADTEESAGNHTKARRFREQADAYEGGDPLDDLREIYGLPDAVDAGSFEGVESIDRVSLPFWIAEFGAQDQSELCYVAVRPTDEGWARDTITSVGWLEQFVASHQSVLESDGHWLGAEDVAVEGTQDRIDRRREEADARPARGQDDEVVDPPETELLDAQRLVDPSPDRSFSDVGGMTALKETLEGKVLKPLEHPDRYREYGLSTVDGVLLHGPPGCGKTYITGALAGELGQSFVRVSPADLSSKYMGEPAQKVQELFAIARANQPCLVFLDELDAVTVARDNDDSNQSEQGMVNQLLTELEGVRDEDVVVVGATNHVEDIDSAIRRSGRFDERVEVPPPDADARREMLRVHLAGRPTSDDLDLSATVSATAGYAASDLERVVDEAARAALADDSPVDTDHLRAAAERTETSIDEWIGRYEFVAEETDGTGTVVQPSSVDHLQADAIVSGDVSRTFEDVGGMDGLQTTLEEKVLEPLRQPERFEQYGLEPTSGVLLYGPPGCGKTYITEALAGELDHFFVEISPAELVSKWMGEPAQRVADLFEIARANQPCLVFLDEIDAVAGSRGSSTNQSGQQLVNQLLTELEAISDENVIVVGATNLIEDVDGAIRRSGRFDERVEVPPPDAEARREILRVHLADRPVADGVDWDRLATATDGYAASDLELVADEAAHRALRAGDSVDTTHLLDAVERTESSLRQWDDGQRYQQSEETSDLR